MAMARSAGAFQKANEAVPPRDASACASHSLLVLMIVSATLVKKN